MWLGFETLRAEARVERLRGHKDDQIMDKNDSVEDLRSWVRDEAAPLLDKLRVIPYAVLSPAGYVGNVIRDDVARSIEEERRQTIPVDPDDSTPRPSPSSAPLLYLLPNVHVVKMQKDFQ